MLLLFAVLGLSALCAASLGSLGHEKKITIAKKFYGARKVSAVTALICWDNHELEFFRAMSAAGIEVLIVHDGTAAAKVFKPRKRDLFYRSGIFVDASCPATRQFLETASSQRLFTILRHWLILDDMTLGTLPLGENTTATDKGAEIPDKGADIPDKGAEIPDKGTETPEKGADIPEKGAEISDRSRALLANVHMLPDSKVTWCQRANGPNDTDADADADADTLLFFEIYKPYIGYPLEASIVGEISVGGNTKMSLLKRDAATAGRGDLKGAVLKAATVIQFPKQFTTMDDLSTKMWDPWSKIHYPVSMYLASQLNFSLEVTVLNSFGWQAPNGSFDGLMGVLQRNEVELTAAGIFMRLDRMEHVEFTADTYKIRWHILAYSHTAPVRDVTKAAILFKQPSLSSVNNIFLLPFSGRLWLGCASLCAVAFIVLASQILCSAATCLNVAEKDCSAEHITISDVVTYVFCIVCQQGFHIVPNALSARTTVFVMSITSLFLFTSFSANIVALLQTPSAAIQNLVDLMESPLRLLIEDIAYNKHYVQESTDEVTRQLIRRKLSFSEYPYLPAKEGMQRIRTGMVAFQVDTTVGYKVISELYTEREKCGLMEIEMYPLPRLAMATVRGSPYRELLGQRLRWLREAGILDRLWKMWVTQKPICENNLAGFVSVSLIEFYPALAVLYYGIVASLLIFAVENLHFHRMTLLRLFVKPRRQRRRHSENEMKRAFNKVAAVPIESRGARAGLLLPLPPPPPLWAWTD